MLLLHLYLFICWFCVCPLFPPALAGGGAGHCRNPSPKRKVRFPDSLVGRAGPLDFETYSGYIPVTAEGEQPEFLFYLLFTTKDRDPRAPLVVFLNGGPGCSSMEGATTENGPLVLFDIKGSGQARAFSRNLYALNAHANVVYIDQPRHVGFSYGFQEKIRSTQEAAADMVTFLQAFTQRGVFPEFAQRQLVLSGESYAGRYIPAFASAILAHNAALPSIFQNHSINLAAIFIGNGCIDVTVQSTHQLFLQFLTESNLLSPADAKDPPRTYTKALRAVVSNIGYNPNMFDYRLAALSCEKCSGGYNYTSWADWMLNVELRSALHVCGATGPDSAGLEAFGQNGGCVSMDNFDEGDAFDYSSALGRSLDAGVLVNLFFGKADLACHYVGGLALADSLPWLGRQGFRQSPLRPLYAHGEIEIGQSKTHGGLTYYQIESAGHMSFIDQPSSVVLVFLSLLRDLAKARKQEAS